jgi:hypothetical protein
MNGIFRTAAAFGLLLGATLMMSACGGGGDTLSLDEYFEEVEALDADTSDRADEVGADVADTEDLDKIKDAFDKLPDVFGDFVAGLEDINPPDEVEDAHKDAIDASNDFLDEYDKLLEDLQDAETLDEITSLVDSRAINKANDRLTAACKDLQEIADDNDIRVSLNCGEE